MRQGLFAIVLVLSSFAGGAVVNGPGLGWVRHQIQGFSAAPSDPDLDELDEDLVEPEIEESSKPSASTPSPMSPVPTPAAPPADDGGPMAPPPPFQLAPAARCRAPAPPRREPAPSPSAAPPVAAPRGPTLASGPSDPPAARLASDARADDPAAASAPPAAPIPPAPVAPAPVDLGSREPWADAPDSAAPANAAVPPPTPVAETGSPVDSGLARTMGGGPTPGGWDEVVGLMKSQGVSRYWLEAGVDGPANFRCVVPLVGDQVVSQHFEAEGATAVEAARAALRRVALWRAARAE